MSLRVLPLARPGRAAVMFAWVVAALALDASLGAASDPVEKLRRAFKIEIDSLRPEPRLVAKRNKLIDEGIDELSRTKSIPQLRRAYFLKEWSHFDPNNKGQATELERRREEIGKLFIAAVSAAAGDGNANEKLAVAMLTAALADEEKQADARGRNDDRKVRGEKLARRMTDVVVRLAKSETDLAVRQAALHALGKITPNPASAVPVLHAALLNDPESGPRRLAAYALVDLVKNARFLGRAERLATLDLAAHVAAQGLQKSSDELTRGYCLQAIEESARACADFLSSPEETLTVDQNGSPKLQKDLKKVLTTFGASNASVVDALHAKETNLRLAALKTLDQIGVVRTKLLQRFQVGPDSHEDRAKLFRDLEIPDPFAGILANDWKRIASLLTDTDVRMRRGAIGFLELLAEQAEPAAESITGALEDPDRSVRWTAARAIRHLPAAKVGPRAIVALGNLVIDADPDLGIAATSAIEALGPAAAPTVDNLAMVIANTDPGNRAWDVDIRVRAMKALLGIGDAPAQKGFAATLTALNDSDVRVRRQAAETISHLGRPIDRALVEPALSALKKALADDDAEVRLNASEAILVVSRIRSDKAKDAK